MKFIILIVLALLLLSVNSEFLKQSKKDSKDVGTLCCKKISDKKKFILFFTSKAECPKKYETTRDMGKGCEGMKPQSLATYGISP